jgi:hypothetical protein
VKPVPESKVHSEFAYILFYRRKDLLSQPLDRVYQTVEPGQWFRGKPVRVSKEFGSKLFGYIWDKEEHADENGRDVYHVKIGGHINLFSR